MRHFHLHWQMLKNYYFRHNYLPSLYLWIKHEYWWARLMHTLNVPPKIKYNNKTGCCGDVLISNSTSWLLLIALTITCFFKHNHHTHVHFTRSCTHAVLYECDSVWGIKIIMINKYSIKAKYIISWIGSR